MKLCRQIVKYDNLLSLSIIYDAPFYLPPSTRYCTLIWAISINVSHEFITRHSQFPEVQIMTGTSSYTPLSFSNLDAKP